MAEKKETDSKDVGTSAAESEKDETNWLASMMRQKLGLNDEEVIGKQVLDDVSFEGVARFIKDNKCKNIITMAGAGISTSAGIPDFRSEGSGLYHNLEKYNLPFPEAIFTLDYFNENPEPFFVLAKELFPGTFKPTPCHYFIRLLHEKGLLLKHYTQNIDTLERVAGIPDDKLVEAHGTFHTSHCLKCRKEFSMECIKEKIMSDTVPKCEEKDCDGVIKPDIVFFGEQLPAKFAESIQQDFPQCDLLIIMGTSLKVQPFASLTSRVSVDCPRLYINLQETDDESGGFWSLFMPGNNFDFDSDKKYRDVFKQATCDDGCQKLAQLIGWQQKLEELIKEGHSKIDKEANNVSK